MSASHRRSAAPHPGLRRSAAPHPGLRIGLTCYPTTGGSGIIATELGCGLARRGHEVHFICYDVPERLGDRKDSVTFHQVSVREYPLLHLCPYPLALAAKLAEVSKACRLDILHVHYGIPHATSAYLARKILGNGSPRLVTTMHGTDVTQVGSDPTLLPVTRLSLLGCDGLTAPSAYLRQAAYAQLELPPATPIEVIPNFVDTDYFRPAPRRDERARVLIHISNFRPLKRVEDAVQILARVREVVPAQLVLVGDGPERPRVEALVRELGLGGSVHILGMQPDFLDLLQQADAFLLPSSSEAFGLAALEALSCAVPVVASRVGGVPEVVSDGETGFLCEAGDVPAMAAATLRLLTDAGLRRRMSAAARESVLRRWQREPTITRYEDYYRRLLARER
jgi:L-malate glycosyltransferase